ncbi:MAG: TIR domain-containing protein [Clostridiales bacterium]|nr:TIR domain-containing protein [Clostridiales bacterium]
MTLYTSILMHILPASMAGLQKEIRMERSYIAFISYKHAPRDSAIAKRVHTLIENYVVPKTLRKGSKKLGVVFRDEEELPISSDLTGSICTALDASKYLIVICSPEASQSPWVAREINYFLRNHDARNIFVILAGGEPQDVFPREVTHILNPATGEYEEVEPLALDVRSDTAEGAFKKLKVHIRKLYAAMLGCSYDTLVQREKSRRMKRLAMLVMLFAVVVSCFMGMLFAKNQELSRKNDELTAAIELSMKRESQLLAKDADEALQDGEIMAAIQYAVEALHSETIERPYSAPAERALFSAIDIFAADADRRFLSKVSLEHHAPIEMMAYSGDGKFIYTIDLYGAVACFDSDSGEEVWNRQLRENEKETFLPVNPQLLYDGQSGIIVCSYDDIITGLDAQTGGILWQHACENSIEQGLFFDAASRKVAYVDEKYVFDVPNGKYWYEYRFMLLSAKTGELLHAIPLMQTEELGSVAFPSGAGTDSNGTFMDSDCFIGTVVKTENDAEESLLYCIDLAGGAVRYIAAKAPGQESNRYNHMRIFAARDNKVIVAEGGLGITMRCFDPVSGALLWETTDLPEEFVSNATECFIIDGQTSFLIGAEKYMAIVDKNSGEIQSSAQLKADLIDLYKLDDRFFAFSLADGYCAAGWVNSYGLRDSNNYSVTVDFPDTSMVASYGGGLVHPTYDGDTPTGFHTPSLADGGGRVTYLSEDRCTAYIATVLPNPELLKPVQFKEKDSDSVILDGGIIDANLQGNLLVKSGNSSNGYVTAVMDAANHTFEIIPLDTSILTYGEHFRLTEDGQYVIACSDYGDIWRIGMDGTIDVLAEDEGVFLGVRGNMEIWGPGHISAEERQNGSGSIITAQSDGKEVAFWTDGENETVIPIPEDVRTLQTEGSTMYELFRVGENGLILLGDYDSPNTDELDGFAVYNLAKKAWKQIPDAVHGTKVRLIVFGESRPVFAVYDADMNIRVYDWDTGDVAYCINTKLPADSVIEFGMLPGEQHVYVITGDGQCIVYSVATGESVFRTVMNGFITAESTAVWFDAANQRLYVKAEDEAVCVDMRSWEELFRYSGQVRNLAFYNAEQNEAYIRTYESDASSYSWEAIRIPTTEELIDIALEVIN